MSETNANDTTNADTNLHPTDQLAKLREQLDGIACRTNDTEQLRTAIVKLTKVVQELVG